MINFDEEKRFKLFEQIYLWFGENKMTLGDVGSGEHFTMLVNNKGVLDMHKTMEGYEKKYEPLVKLDLKEISEQLKNNPNIIKNFAKEIMDNVKQVDFTESEFADCKVVLVKDKEEMTTLAKKIKRQVILDENAVNDVERIPWSDAKGRIKEKALVLNKDGFSIGYLFNQGDKIFFMDGDFMLESYFKNLILNMATFYKSEEY